MTWRNKNRPPFQAEEDPDSEQLTSKRYLFARRRAVKEISKYQIDWRSPLNV